MATIRMRGCWDTAGFRRRPAIRVLARTAIVLTSWQLAIIGSTMILSPKTLWCALAAGSESGTADPTATVKAIIDQATAVVQNTQLPPAERDKHLRAIAEANFDFANMARTTLGYHWRQLTPQQRDQFVPLFTSFMEDVYLGKMRDYGVEKIRRDVAGSNVTFTGQNLDGPDDAEVHSKVILEGRAQPVKVDYLMKRDGTSWKIYDLEIDAISVMANYRNQFNRVINDQGYPALMSTLQKKSQQLGSNLSK
jgi:phospholipid transport system substrate-binding protein